MAGVEGTKSVPWTDDDKAKARKMWGEGAPTKDIGAALGREKNSVIGMARREGFPPRPSPIGVTGLLPAPRPRTKDLPRGQRRPPPPPKPEPLRLVATPVPALLPVEPETPRPPPRMRPTSACCWPLWPHGARPDMRFCDARAPAGRPYCAEHHALAYPAITLMKKAI